MSENTFPTVVGFCGLAGAGKNTAAEALVPLGYNLVAFADPIREALAALNPIVSDDDGRWCRLREAVAFWGWDDCKRRMPMVRELMQRMGTEVGRNIFGHDFWVEQMRRRITATPYPKKIAITDIRFENEARLVRDFGGVIVAIQRPGVVAMSHVSEQQTFEADFHVLNSGSVDELEALVVEVLRKVMV